MYLVEVSDSGVPGLFTNVSGVAQLEGGFSGSSTSSMRSRGRRVPVPISWPSPPFSVLQASSAHASVGARSGTQTGEDIVAFRRLKLHVDPGLPENS